MSDTKDTISLALAVTGTVLGILNTLSAFKQRRVSVSVRAIYARYTGTAILNGTSEGDLVGIEVTNKSSFAIYVSQIGFTIPGQVNRRVFLNPITMDNQPFRRAIQPHQSLTGYAHRAELQGKIGRSFAELENGKTFFGKKFA